MGNTGFLYLGHRGWFEVSCDRFASCRSAADSRARRLGRINAEIAVQDVRRTSPVEHTAWRSSPRRSLRLETIVCLWAVAFRAHTGAAENAPGSEWPTARRGRDARS